jgi:multidrug efflux pump subunit AcrA (membrane-fusion protein)
MKLAQVNPLKVELIAPTEYFGLIKKGMQVEIYPEKPADRIFMATVSIVDRLIDPASGSFNVTMTLPNPDESLVGGVNCLANLNFDEPDDAEETRSARRPGQTSYGLALSHSLRLGR